MSRKAVAILILLVWFGALGWLAQRRTVGIHSGVIVRTWPMSPGAAFFGVYRGDHQVGLATLSIDTLVEGLRTDELVTLDLPQPTRSVRRSTLRTEALYSKSLRLLRWETNLLTDDGRSVVQGVLGEDGVITIYNGLGGAVETLTVASPAEPLLLPGAVPFLLANADNRKIGRILTPTGVRPGHDRDFFHPVPGRRGINLHRAGQRGVRFDHVALGHGSRRHDSGMATRRPGRWATLATLGGCPRDHSAHRAADRAARGAVGI